MANKKNVIRFTAQVNDQTVNSLINIIETKIKDGVNEFDLLISSPGGFVSSGITAYNYLIGIPATINTHNFGNVDSIAAVIYCAGKKRSTSFSANFLIHSVAWNGNGGFEEKKMKEFLGNLEVDRENISRIIAKTCSQPIKDIEKMMLEGVNLNPEKAKKLGLVNEISDTLYDQDSEVFSIS